MIVNGTGSPLVMIPGLDGHGSWLRPAVDALAPHFRVAALSLCGEPDSGRPFGTTDRFDVQLDQLDEVVRGFDAADTHRAGPSASSRVILCGVSYGGWIAVSYAARHPERVAALILVSSPPPDFVPNQRQTRYLGSPIRSAPSFVLTAPQRLGPEILSALPTWSGRLRFAVGHVGRIVRTGLSPSRMARRMHVAKEIDFFAACRQVTAPALIVTGQPGLDRVVPVEETRKYLTLLPGAEIVALPGTGHFGHLTRADRFAEAVTGFVARTVDARERRLPRVG